MTHDHNYNFGQFTRQLRKQRGLSQDTIAKALDFEHRSNVHRLETGKLEWKLSSVFKLAELLDINASELLRRYENQ